MKRALSGLGLALLLTGCASPQTRNAPLPALPLNPLKMVAHYQLGAPMPDYKQGTVFGSQAAWQQPQKGIRCRGAFQSYYHGSDLVYQAAFPDFKPGPFPYAVYDVRQKILLVDSNLDGKIDKILKNPRRMTASMAHPYCREKVRA